MMPDDQQRDAARPRRVAVDLAALESALEESSWEAAWYLDLETGRLVRVDAETRRDLEEVYEEIGSAEGAEPVGLAEILKARDLPKWRKEALAEADEVEQGFGVRFIAVPRADSRQDYADLEEFIATVEDERLRARLSRAIQGRGAFGRFRDTLHEAPAERERWPTFKTDQVRARALAWLESEGVEPIVTPEPERDQARVSPACLLELNSSPRLSASPDLRAGWLA